MWRQFQDALETSHNGMRFPIVCPLTLLLAFHSLEIPAEAQSSSLERELKLIKHAQQEQQRKLFIAESKLNQIISRLLSLEHFHRELTGSVRAALLHWQKLSKQNPQQHFNEEQLSLQCKSEQARRIEEIHAMLARLLSVRQGQPATNKSDRAKVAYMQPAKADCSELDEQQRLDGVYKFLEPELNERQRDFNERRCAFATAGAAWTVIQHRQDENNPHWENFNRSWDEYRAGFGDLENDFWFGNEFIHRLAYRDDHELRVELEDRHGVHTWIEYGIFRLDSESYAYQLEIGELNGNSSATDSLNYHNHMEFKANDWNDDCVGWWLDHCQEAQSNLNGQRILWQKENGVKASRMLIRPRNLRSPSTDDVYD